MLQLYYVKNESNLISCFSTMTKPIITPTPSRIPCPPGPRGPLWVHQIDEFVVG